MEARTAKHSRRSGPATLDPQPGMLIGGRYTIVRLIARGGVGLVYLARQSVSNAAVVVKVLAGSQASDAEAIARFDREAQRLRSMQHPNIVEMVDYGHANGSAYLVMEYLQGELLSAYAARKGPLSLAEFTPIAAQILKAVGYAHERGLMHRDLKPSNIMLCVRRGRGNFVKILDFGMAKLIDGERDITSEQIVGTANYLSPEQIRGEVLDARVDVYAIGITFYALLAGRLPFHADNNAALLYKHVHELPPPLFQVLPQGHDVPDGLISLVHRCLSKRAEDRPADANAIVAAMVECIPGELFHLPVAEGGSATPSSSYAVLPANVDAGPEDLSDRLTRPVPTLRAARQGAAASVEAPVVAPPTRTGRTRNRPVVRPATAPVVRPSSPLLIEPPAESSRLWIVLAGIVLLGLLGLGGYLLTRAGRPAEGPAPIDERQLGARLEQVEMNITGRELERARRELDAVQPRVAGAPRLREHAEALRRRLDIATATARAEELEAAGDIPAALSSYRDVLALEPHHPEARAAVDRLRAATRTPTASPTTLPAPTTPPPQPAASKPRPRPVDRPAEPSEPEVEPPSEPEVEPPSEPVKSVERPVEGPVEVAQPEPPPKPDGDLLGAEGKKKKDAPIFLPTD